MRFIFISLFLLNILPCFSQVESNYYRLIDSADVSLETYPERTLLFLDSITKPLDNNIDGRLGEYYYLRSIALERTQQEAKSYQASILSLKYAEIEGNFKLAGDAAIMLFTNTYFIKRDTTAYKFLEQAKIFYEKSNSKSGLLDVQQMPAYIYYTEKEYKKSNDLLLDKLDEYKNHEETAYYYLFATYMLTSNYIHLKDLENANKYLKEFNNLKIEPTIDSYDYNYYNVSLEVCMSKLYLDNDKIDSTLYYLSRASKHREFMTNVSKGEFFSFSAEAYKEIGDYDKSNLYLDSLKNFQEKVLVDNIDASLEINDDFLNAEEALQLQKNKVDENRNWLLILISVIVGLIIIFFFGYKRFNSKSKSFSLQKKDISKLQSNNEKLKVRTHELENYIADIKEQFKKIASLDNEDVQKEKIRGLYRNLNAETSRIKNSEENHISVLKKLNEPFFLKLNKDHPDLTDIDCLVSYYLKLGFMNKEIAFFLDKTVRGIESQRYRISKKLMLQNSKELVGYLNDHY